MGRKPLQIIWVTFSMIVGSIGGIKLADILFWNDDKKYQIWEETETNYWKNHEKPKHLEPMVEFDSVIHPGAIYKSYIPEITFQSVDEILDKYQV